MKDDDDSKLTPHQFRKKHLMDINQHVAHCARELGSGAQSPYMSDSDCARLLRLTGKRNLSADQWSIARGAFREGSR